MKPLSLFLTAILAVMPGIRAMADDKNAIPVAWDTHPDTWVAVDELGREVATADAGTAPAVVDSAATVGMFYYLWHGEHADSGKDISRLLQENAANPDWGAEHAMHWSSSPWMGYYHGGDPYIISRHIQMLTDAGVDFLFFDCTNAFPYVDNVRAVISELERRRSLGMRYPRLAFMLHSNPAPTAATIFREFYKDKPENDIYWFFHEGKPLMLAPADEMTSLGEEILGHFTFRNSWAWRQQQHDLPYEWSWLENHPQKPGWRPEASADGERKTLHNGENAASDDGEIEASDNRERIMEQMSVSVAQHPTSRIGKSFHNGNQPAVDRYGMCRETPFGLYFQEQWDEAIRVHPPLVMVTQFNEWIAQRFIVKNEAELPLTRPGAEERIGETYFVDVYSPEFSRDIEPSSHPSVRDNYYLQMVSNTRRYRGAGMIPAPTRSLSIDLDGDFSQWDAETVEYRDDIGDTFFTSASVQSPETLERPTNDIVRAKVTKDAGNLYFYVETVAPMGSHTTADRWMNLLLNTDCDYSTGWNGYDFIVRRDHATGVYSLMRHSEPGSYSWQAVAPVKYRVVGNRMHLSVPRALIGHESAEKDLDFKWTDNVTESDPDILRFISDGDVAPNGRFNYRYKGSAISHTGR